MRTVISIIINAIKRGDIDLHHITSSDFKKFGILGKAANAYLSKHSKPSKYSEYFVKTSKGVYKINEDNQKIKSILQD